MARDWLRWWHHTNGRLWNNSWAAARTYWLSSRATEVLWEPLRRWMGLHDLKMWERRHDGRHVQYRIHEFYWKSCSYAWRRWRWKFREEKQGVGTKLLRSHYRWLERLYHEAAARVMARCTYDGHDCLTLTGTPSGVDPSVRPHQHTSWRRGLSCRTNMDVNAASVVQVPDSPVTLTPR